MERRQTSSGVSLAIAKTMTSYENHKPLIENESKANFTIKIANTQEEREAVFHLGYQIYLEKGYIQKNDNEWMIQNYDFDSETVILIVQDKSKKIIGSVTIVFDKESVLPAEKIYRDEIQALRNSGHKIAEISRLVVDPTYRNAKKVLVLLFNYLCIYIHHVKQYSGIAITVNPRHQAYYQTILSFDLIGTEKPCPHVKNAPAVFLFLTTLKYQSEVGRCYANQKIEKRERSLFQYYLKLEQEPLVALYLQKQSKPMTIIEKQYFGFSETGFSRVVCVNN